MQISSTSQTRESNLAVKKMAEQKYKEIQVNETLFSE